MAKNKKVVSANEEAQEANADGTWAYLKDLYAEYLEKIDQNKEDNNAKHSLVSLYDDFLRTLHENSLQVIFRPSLAWLNKHCPCQVM